MVLLVSMLYATLMIIMSFIKLLFHLTGVYWQLVICGAITNVFGACQQTKGIHINDHQYDSLVVGGDEEKIDNTQ